MRALSEIEVRRKTWQLLELLRDSENPDEWIDISTELTTLLAMYWDIHPHSAMEALEQTVLSLPIKLAKPLVSKVVQTWKSKSNYDPDAGGSADHCYLSALILSDNYALADQPWAKQILTRVLEKEMRPPKYGPNHRASNMRDYDQKQELVKTLKHLQRDVPVPNE